MGPEVGARRQEALTASPVPSGNEAAPGALIPFNDGSKRMVERILLIEPYHDLVNTIGFALEELGYRFDVVTDANINEMDFLKKPYACVLINIDQNSDQWRSSGLSFAATASKLNLPVVMIADHKLSAATAFANGWKPLQKPFTIDSLSSAISKAVGAT
jgi:DNA-binding NtrC family response regulator